MASPAEAQSPVEDPEDPEEERVSQKLCSLTCCDLHGLKTKTPADNVHTHTQSVCGL